MCVYTDLCIFPDQWKPVLEVQYSNLAVQYRNLAVQYRNLAVQYRNLEMQYRNLEMQYRNLAVQYRNLAVQYPNLISAYLMEINFSSFKYRLLKSLSLEKLGRINTVPYLAFSFVIIISYSLR